MKALILGGYGVFGGFLARLLLRDGVEVAVAGRDLAKASDFARRHGGRPIRVDIGGDLAPVADAAPDVVVDAAGPFQAYGADPYRLARFCIAHGMDYLDFSDDGAFTAGIAALDAEAKRAGRRVLSGVSTVPAISAAAAARLGEGFSEILSIESAILPGNRAPRGRSVIASILGQAGAPLKIWRGGVWREQTGWTDRRRLELRPGDRRSASLMGAPDLVLFPARFQARSVLFRAGLELGAMHDGLTLLSLMRRRGLLPGPTWLVSPVLWAARLAKPFGTDRGGMIVEIVGMVRGEPVRRRWRLLAEAGDGPFIPAIAARAVIRRLGGIAPGARPCIADLSLAELEAAASDLAVRFDIAETAAPTLFQRATGARWAELPASIRRTHAVQDMESFSGLADVTRGAGPVARLAAWVFGFPPAGNGVRVRVTKWRQGDGELWQRDFGGAKFRSHLSPSVRPGHIIERFGLFAYELALPVAAGCLHFGVRRGWFLGLPIPRRLLPRSETREFEAGGKFHFDVALYAPLTDALIVRYQGWLDADAGCPAQHERRLEEPPSEVGTVDGD
ncbi:MULTISPECIES: SDR family oxidoreductase [Rhodomicrobium]|uniref:SDR family oxidoreductase n=1 Tax=Rhodomicrobium TaxID=1068 RepID=UPI000B4B46C3|nr:MULTISPECIES: SDR family oxidoreductase [Rhodomicrobium]